MLHSLRLRAAKAVLVATFFWTLPGAQAAIINVPDDYASIQAGIDATVDLDTVVVAPGTYLEKPVNPVTFIRSIQRALGIEQTDDIFEKLNLFLVLILDEIVKITTSLLEAAVLISLSVFIFPLFILLFILFSISRPKYGIFPFANSLLFYSTHTHQIHQSLWIK